jgi:hypothetical protein
MSYDPDSDHTMVGSPRWQILESGMVRQVRSRWRREGSSPQPSLDAVNAYNDKADRLRLVIDPRRAQPVDPADRKYMLRVLQGTLIVSVVGQRIAIPIGSGIALPLFVAYIGIFLMRRRGGLRYNRVRSELFILASGAIVLSAWLTGWLGNDVSINSLLLLLAIYLPWVFCISPQFSDLFLPMLRTFVRLMVVTAAIGAVEILIQLLLHWKYQDFLASWLPAKWLQVGFNTNYPLAYNNPVIKANAFYFLEPSFLCQFCSLALIISLLIRAPAWQPLLLGLGMAATLSGTGILLLIVGIVLLLILVPDRIKPSYLLAGIVGLAIIFSTPAANILLDRRDEASQSGSSGNIRFVEPYTQVSQGLALHPARYLVGAGSGASDRLLESSRAGSEGAAVVYGIGPKMAFEYGLITAGLFIAFLLISILRGPPLPVLPTCVVFMIFFLSGSLLQPHTIVLAWMMTSMWGAPVALGVSDALAGSLRQRQRQPGYAGTAGSLTGITDS